MTYQQKFEQLQKDFAEKADRFLKAEKEFSAINGWGDSNELRSFLQSQREWQEASNAYYQFLTFAQKNGIDPEDQYPEKPVN